MKILAVFLYAPLLVYAQSAPAGVVFTSGAQTVAVGAMSETLTIQAQDANGNAFKLPSTGCLALSSSASGEFSSSATSWSAVSVLTMNKNSANRNFYYKGTVAGAHTLTVRLVLKLETEDRSCANWPIAEWPTGWSASQNISIGGDSGEAPVQNPPLPPPLVKEGGGGGLSDPAPSLVVKAAGPTAAIAGADAVFSAQVFGTKKEPIDNARVVWNFGNGASREGASVRFAYNIPGSYVVLVEAASGGLSGTARFTVSARAPEISVARAVPGPEGFIEIETKSAAEMDVSGWGIASGSTLFTIPEKTFLLPKTKVAFPASATGAFVVGEDARLLFPNGKLAAAYVPAPPVNIPRPPQADTPFKGGTFHSPLEGSAPSPASSAGKEARGRDVSSATTTPAAIVLSLDASTPHTPLWQWLAGVLGVGVVGAGSLIAFRLKPATLDTRTDAEKFAEGVTIES